LSGGPPPDACRVVGVGQQPSRSTKKGTAMSKVSTLRVVSKDRAPQLPDLDEEVRLALSEAAVSAREGLLAMSVATGLKVMHAMMQAEITGLWCWSGGRPDWPAASFRQRRSRSVPEWRRRSCPSHCLT
jgi:hypothetical protein